MVGSAFQRRYALAFQNNSVRNLGASLNNSPPPVQVSEHHVSDFDFLDGFQAFRRQYEGARWEAWRTAHNQIGLPFIWVSVDFRNIPEIGNIRVMVLQDG